MYFIIFFTFKSPLFFDFSNVIYASTFSEADLKYFNTNLKNAAKNIANQVLSKPVNKNVDDLHNCNR